MFSVASVGRVLDPIRSPLGMLHDWPIQPRADHCALSGQPFADGEPFHTLLYRDKHTPGLHRLDICAAAWRDLQKDPAAAPPFSHWRGKFVLPPPPEKTPETLPKDDAETLLRRFLGPDSDVPPEPGFEKVCYILALTLERKRRFRPVDTREDPTTGRRLLFYEHRGTGESFVIVDPGLHLDQLEAVQREVADLLASSSSPPPDAVAAAEGANLPGPG